MSENKNWINGNFVRDAIEARYNYVTDTRHHGWREFSTQGMADYFFDLIEEAGVDGDNTASYYVDNALINGEWGLASNWGYNYEEAKKKYEDGDLIYFEENTLNPEDPYIVIHF